MTPARKPRTLSAFAEERAKASFAEHEGMARDLRAARTEARETQAKIAELEQELGIYRVLETAKTTPPRWLAPKTPGKGHRAIPCLVIADVHFGETVSSAEIEGINAYSPAIATQRIQRAFAGAVSLCRDYLTGVEYDGITVCLPGDMVSGEPHQELRETNAQTVAESVMACVEPLEAGLNLLAEEFGAVHVVGVPGNHPRNTVKPIAKRRARDNWDTLLYRVIERDYRRAPAAAGAVTVQVSDAADAPFTIYGTRYVLTHGDQFHGGSGIAGAISPLLLGAHRKTRRAAASGRPYDLLIMGHWHQSIFYPSKGLIVSGCLKGYDEYAYLANFEPEPAQAALWLTTPERGVTVSAPVFVQDRAAEGW